MKKPGKGVAFEPRGVLKSVLLTVEVLRGSLYTITNRIHSFKRNKLHVISIMVVRKNCSETAVGLELFTIRGAFCQTWAHRVFIGKMGTSRGSLLTLLKRGLYPFLLDFTRKKIDCKIVQYPAAIFTDMCQITVFFFIFFLLWVFTIYRKNPEISVGM